MAVARIFNTLLFRTRRFFISLINDSVLYLKDLICISTVLSPIVSHYFKPQLLSPGLPNEHVNFQATSSMSPWASLVASDSNH